MSISKKYTIFVSSDRRSRTSQLDNFLNKYSRYELHFIPTVLSVFDMLKMEPDVIVLDQQAQKVVRCHQWN